MFFNNKDNRDRNYFLRGEENNESVNRKNFLSQPMNNNYQHAMYQHRLGSMNEQPINMNTNQNIQNKVYGLNHNRNNYFLEQNRLFRNQERRTNFPLFNESRFGVSKQSQKEIISPTILNDLNAEKELDRVLEIFSPFSGSNLYKNLYGTSDLQEIAKKNEVNHQKWTKYDKENNAIIRFESIVIGPKKINK